MPVLDGLELIVHAMNQKQNDDLYWRWVIGYQDRLTFEDFKEKLGLTPKQENVTTNDTKPIEAILKDVQSILDMAR